MNPEDLNDYRPIAQTSILMKEMGRFVFRHLN